MMKFLNLLALFTSLSIAGIAAYFSILGLATIFAGAYLGVVVMASVLEFGKIVTAAYLHLVWDKLGFMKYYLALSVFVLMLITSLGIFGYLAKASSDTSYATGVAQSEINRIESIIGREENKILTLENRIESLGTGQYDITDAVNAQITIRDGAWERVQGDIEYAEGNITSIRGQLTTLDTAVNELRNKGVEVIRLEEATIFDAGEVEKIDYIAQANELFEQQRDQRERIASDINKQQENIDNYRAQAQTVINEANAEIRRLQTQNTDSQDNIIADTEEYTIQIDEIYDTIEVLKEEKFVFDQEILGFEKEVGPIKYIAEVIYGQDESVKYLDNAIRAVIFALIFVFDPLAILLLITSVGLIARRMEDDKPKVIEQRYILQVPKKKMDDIRKTTL
jgi:hypothetical protein